MGTGLTPGQRAHVDQVLALVNEVEHAWPWNQQLLNDLIAETVVLDRLGAQWQGMRDDRAYLLWSNGRLAELRAINEYEVTRQVIETLPRREVECDLCPIVGVPAGVAVIAVPRNLVALVLCALCSNRLNPDVFIQTGVSNG